MSEELVAIGEILAPHGIAGEVKVKPLGSFPERFRIGLKVRISGRDGIFRVNGVRWRGKTLLLKLSEVNDRDDAEQLRGARLLVTPDERFPLPDYVYYVDDLIGTTVKLSSGERLGVLMDVMENPANDLFVVQLDTGQQALIPGVREFITVDLAAKEIIVNPIPGLIPGEVDDEN